MLLWERMQLLAMERKRPIRPGPRPMVEGALRIAARALKMRVINAGKQNATAAGRICEEW